MITTTYEVEVESSASYWVISPSTIDARIFVPPGVTCTTWRPLTRFSEEILSLVKVNVFCVMSSSPCNPHPRADCYRYLRESGSCSCDMTSATFRSILPRQAVMSLVEEPMTNRGDVG